MGAALLVEYYQRMPGRRTKDDAETWRKRQEEGRQKFLHTGPRRYNEGTLLRLLESTDPKARRASLLALGQFGTHGGQRRRRRPPQRRRRRGPPPGRRALWALWFRADDEENNRELQRLMRLRDREKAVAGLDRSSRKARASPRPTTSGPSYYFRMKQFERSIADCEKVLQLNPCHFGAQAGMAQCYMQLRKHKAALRAFRAALRINPNLDGVAETIRALENALGEEGRKDDKK